FNAVPETFTAFPAPARKTVALGHARVVEFQDAAYGELYLQRLSRVLARDSSSDFALTRETARFLALWMAFDDVIRVADLKTRASRFARVRAEVQAGEGDVVRIVDFMKPGVPEFAGLLPPRWAARLSKWDRARPAPLQLAVKLRTDSITGFVALR